ncbi:MAG: type II secretion system protein [Clostridia bacterium]|nr:type II secretion system protein [Clostridia bacterium]
MKKGTKKGFTLVELIIVIAVIGVLAAILIPVFSNVIDKGNAKSAFSDAKNYCTQYVDAAVTEDIPVNDLLIYAEKGGKIYTFAYEADEGKVEEVAIEPKEYDENETLKDQSEDITNALHAIGAVQPAPVDPKFSMKERELVDNLIHDGYENLYVRAGLIVQDMTNVDIAFDYDDEFAAGEGTKENPFVVATAEQFENIQNYENMMYNPDTHTAQPYYFKLACDIDMNDVLDEDDDWVFVDNFYGVIDGSKLDGGSYSIIAPDTVGTAECFFFTYQTIGEATFKNVKLVQKEHMFSFVYAAYYTVNMENVTIESADANVATRARARNQSPFVFTPMGNSRINFKNCVNNCNITSTDTYNGIFIGGYAQPGSRISFVNCVNNARVTGNKIGFLFGNMGGGGCPDIMLTHSPIFATVGSATAFYVENCENNGFLRGATECGLFAQTAANVAKFQAMEAEILAECGFKKGTMEVGSSDIVISHDGTKYTATSSALSGVDYMLSFSHFINIDGAGSSSLVVEVDMGSDNTVALPLVKGARVEEDLDAYNAITTYENAALGALTNGEYRSATSDYDYKVEMNADGSITFVFSMHELRFAHNASPWAEVTLADDMSTFIYAVDGAGEVAGAREFIYTNGAFEAK